MHPMWRDARRFQDRGKPSSGSSTAYRQYCWPVHSLDDLKLAPFHLLATEGTVHTDQNHVWHMETLAAICRQDPGLLAGDAVQDRRTGRPGQRGGRCRVVAGTHRAGRRGNGREAVGFRRARQEGTGPTGGEMPRPGVSADHLRPRYTSPENLSRLRSAGWARSGRWLCANSPWGSRPWSASSAANRCAESMNASSACWPWRASRSIRGCKRVLMPCFSGGAVCLDGAA